MVRCLANGAPKLDGIFRPKIPSQCFIDLISFTLTVIFDPLLTLSLLLNVIFGYDYFESYSSDTSILLACNDEVNVLQ